MDWLIIDYTINVTRHYRILTSSKIYVIMWENIAWYSGNQSSEVETFQLGIESTIRMFLMFSLDKPFLLMVF